MGNEDTNFPITPLTLSGVTTDLYDACKALMQAWDNGEESNEVEWEELVLAVGIAEAASEKVDNLSAQAYCVVMRNHRESETDKPLFWSSSQQWVSLRAADVFAIGKEASPNELLTARFPRDAWGFVELPSWGRIISLP